VAANGTGNGHDPELMTPGEVAALFRVDPKTVTKWARAGKLTCIRTLGGHRRYQTAEIRALLATAQIPEQAADGPDLDDVARQCPRWRFWQGVSGNLYAHLRHSSPPVVVRGSNPADLRETIRRAEDGLP
jgi:excisionase family DNA binding protein